jgi:hypothetical protein
MPFVSPFIRRLKPGMDGDTKGMETAAMEDESGSCRR